MRYAWFGDARRLAIEERGVVSVYDSGEHRIGGVSQYQGLGRAVSFVSQFGEVDVARLPLARDEEETQAARDPAPSRDRATPFAAASSASRAEPPPRDPFVALERLADLHARGIVDDGEFARKKAELLERI